MDSMLRKLFYSFLSLIEVTHYTNLNSFKTLSVVSHNSLAKSSLLASSLASSRTPYGTKYFPLYLSRSSTTWREAAAHAGVYPPSCGEIKKSERPQLITLPKVRDVKSLTFPSVTSANGRMIINARTRRIRKEGSIPDMTLPGCADMAVMGIFSASNRRCNSVVQRIFASFVYPAQAHSSLSNTLVG